MFSKTFKIPIYGGQLKVIQCGDVKRIIEKYNLDIKADQFDALVFFDIKKGGLKCYAVFKKGITADIIAHETVHVVNDIFKHVRIELDPKNDEAQAYLTGWVFRKIFKTVKSKK